MIDRTLKHYRVIAALGAGGMGEVYLAQDTKLDRKVALKILPADVASNRDRMERFVREAKAAAALNHPNIAHIYEIGDSEGTPFIAMEYVDGVTLREKIHHSGEPLSALLGYLAQVAEGLAKAHHAGIVHRDLKPDNVMITRDGYAKILDFGLAKLVESPGPFGIDQEGSDRTIETVPQSMPGMVLGTIGYMSPEQASGRVHEIDHRSDIFSFGCLLFEATTGQMAFEGKDALDSLHKIVYAPTPQVKDVTRVAPEALQRVIGRCLAKDPARRYQSIKDLAIEVDDLRQELKSLTGPLVFGSTIGRGDTVRSQSCGRRVLGRGIAVQAPWRARRPRSAGRRPRRGHRHGPHAVLPSPRRLAQLRAALQRRSRGHSHGGQGARRPLRDGGEPAPGGLDAARGGAARGCDDRRASLGRDIRPRLQPRRDVRAAR